MLEEHVKLMSVLQTCGEVVGRKKLQKMIFIAKKLNFPFYEKYDFHFYGPYSEEVTLKIEELSNLGLVEEIQEKVNGYVQYRYSLSEAGERFLTNFHVDFPSLRDCVQMMNKENARFLELVSTILYFDEFARDEIIRKVEAVKANQQYTEQEFQHAFKFIEKLKALCTHAPETSKAVKR